METENRLIADFMGLLKISNETYPILYKDKNSDEWFAPDELKYHSDWNWLMEVVNRIKQVGEEELKFSVEFQLAILTLNKETIYNECLEFIKWYNEQNQ